MFVHGGEGAESKFFETTKCILKKGEHTLIVEEEEKETDAFIIRFFTEKPTVSKAENKGILIRGLATCSLDLINITEIARTGL